MTLENTDDLRIKRIRPLLPPAILMEEVPLGESGSHTVAAARRACADILHGRDDRLLVVVGPCSVHDIAAATAYADLLRPAAARLAGELMVVMRVYFEKPRTTVGWKGLINDPRLDGSYAINEGLRTARRLLVDLAATGMPAGCEFLDPITPQFIADCVAWGAIGARTTESQVHRDLASGLSMPVGFKNGTDGGLQIAVDALRAAAHPHHFLSVTKEGLAAIVETAGNRDCHVILRGARSGPNYDRASVEQAGRLLAAAGLPSRLMVDCSHGNSSKDHRRQAQVAGDLAARISQGEREVFGVMIESHLEEGRQDIPAAGPAGLAFGRSVTDACLGWRETLPLLEQLAQAVATRRRL